MSRTIYSFIIDTAPAFPYQGWHLAKSLCLRCAAAPDTIHVQLTDAVPSETVRLFAACGYRTHRLRPFGDGKWCNKLAQLPNLLGETFDIAVLLDTDMIAVADVRTFLRSDFVQAKVVDFPNPSLAVLKELYSLAGGDNELPIVRTDGIDAPTLQGNCNGGFYAVPRPLAENFSEEWRRWAAWLFENDEPLRRAGRMKNVDQISAALAFRRSMIPYADAPANVNYFLHAQAEHSRFDASRPIALLHYHDTLDPIGMLAPSFPLNPAEKEAVTLANESIQLHRQPTLRPR